MISVNQSVKELKQEIEQLESDKFAFFCNDQYDICDKIDKQIKDRWEKIEILNNIKL